MRRKYISEYDDWCMYELSTTSRWYTIFKLHRLRNQTIRIKYIERINEIIKYYENIYEETYVQNKFLIDQEENRENSVERNVISRVCRKLSTFRMLLTLNMTYKKLKETRKDIEEMCDKLNIKFL